MARGETKSSSEAKLGFIEYLLLAVLLLMVVVTAWTLWDNGIVDTVANLIDDSLR